MRKTFILIGGGSCLLLVTACTSVTAPQQRITPDSAKIAKDGYTSPDGTCLEGFTITAGFWCRPNGE